MRNIDPLSRMRGSTTITNNNKIIKSHRVQKPSNNNSTEVVRSTTTKTSIQRQGSIGVGVATKNKTIASTTLNNKSHYNSPPSMIEKRDDDDDNSLVSIGTFTVGGEDTPRDDLVDNTNDNFNEGSSSNKRKVRWSTTVNDNLPKTTKATSTTGCGSILPFPPLCYNNDEEVSSSSSSSNVTDGKVITNIYQDIKNKVDDSTQIMNDKLSSLLSLSINDACGNSTIISTGGCNNGLNVRGAGNGECTKEINGGYTDNFTTALEDSNDKVLPLNEENDLLLNTGTTILKQEDMLPTTVQDVHSSSRTRVVTTSAAPMKKKNQLPTARRTVRRQVVAPTASHCAKLSSTSTKAKRIINNAKQQQQRRRTRDITNTSNKRFNTKNVVSVKGSSKNVSTSTTVLPTSSSPHPHNVKLNDSTTIPTTTLVKEKSSPSRRRSNNKKKLIDKLKKPSLNVVNILLKSNNIQRMKNRGLLPKKLCHLAYYK